MCECVCMCVCMCVRGGACVCMCVSMPISLIDALEAVLSMYRKCN